MPRPLLTPGRPWSRCGCWSPAASWCSPPLSTRCMTCSARTRRPSIKVSWQYKPRLCDLTIWCQGCGLCAGPWWSSTCWRGWPGPSWASTGSSARGSSPASAVAMTASHTGSALVTNKTIINVNKCNQLHLTYSLWLVTSQWISKRKSFVLHCINKRT